MSGRTQACEERKVEFGRKVEGVNFQTEVLALVVVHLESKQEEVGRYLVLLNLTLRIVIELQLDLSLLKGDLF